MCECLCVRLRLKEFSDSSYRQKKWYIIQKMNESSILMGCFIMEFLVYSYLNVYYIFLVYSLHRQQEHTDTDLVLPS